MVEPIHEKPGTSPQGNLPSRQAFVLSTLAARLLEVHRDKLVEIRKSDSERPQFSGVLKDVFEPTPGAITLEIHSSGISGVVPSEGNCEICFVTVPSTGFAIIKPHKSSGGGMA